MKPLPLLTPWAQFVNRWKGCTTCELHATRQKVVLARGEVPCDVLLIGEAPGMAEDTIGIPFVGPAGQLLDKIIDQAISHLRLCPVCLVSAEETLENKSSYSMQYPDEDGQNTCPNGHKGVEGRPVKLCWTNLVCCIPLEEDGSKNSDPPDEAVQACSVRLLEFLDIAHPKLIICVGTIPRDWFDVKYKHAIKIPQDIPVVSITHPAAILRANIAQKGLMFQRNVVALKNAVEGYLGG